MFDLVCGLGQGGSRLGREFAINFNKPAVYMNLSAIDFSKFDAPRHSMLVVENGGTGKNPVIGERVVRNNFDKVRVFLNNIKRFDVHKYILITVGGGGGSGTGFVFPLIDYLLKRKKQILLVYTTPEKREGVPTKPNSLLVLNRIIKDYLQQKKGVSVLLVDNDFCMAKYGVSGYSYWYKVNKGIVNSLKRFWLMTNLEKLKNYIDVSSGYKALDKNDLKRILYSHIGYVDIIQLNFDSANLHNINFNNSSLVFKEHSFNTASKCVIALGIPDEWKQNTNILNFSEYIFNAVSEISKNAIDVVRCSYFNKKIHRAHLNILFSGITKSKGLQQLIKDTEKDIKRISNIKPIKLLNLDNIVKEK